MTNEDGINIIFGFLLLLILVAMFVGVLKLVNIQNQKDHQRAMELKQLEIQMCNDNRN